MRSFRATSFSASLNTTSLQWLSASSGGSEGEEGPSRHWGGYLCIGGDGLKLSLDQLGEEHQRLLWQRNGTAAFQHREQIRLTKQRSARPHAEEEEARYRSLRAESTRALEFERLGDRQDNRPDRS